MIKGMIMTVAVAWAALCPAQKNDWAGLGLYAGSNKEVKALPAADRRVVFFGNSITHAWNGADPDFFKTHKYIPRGFSGQTSYQFLVRLRPDLSNASLTDICGGDENKVLLYVGFSMLIVIPAIFQLFIRMKKPQKRN